MMTAMRKPTALIILDGWGHRDPAEDNAISNASTPFWDKLWQSQPKTLINTSGMFVGPGMKTGFWKLMIVSL